MTYYDFERELYNRINNIKMNLMSRPLVLGGVASISGGSGGPPGGFIGFLPQTRVAFDSSELAVSGTSTSGYSLLDNLNHIRYRLVQLEEGGATTNLIVSQDGAVVAENVTVIDFEGATVTATESGVLVTISGGGTGTGDLSGAGSDKYIAVWSGDSNVGYADSIKYGIKSNGAVSLGINAEPQSYKSLVTDTIVSTVSVESLLFYASHNVMGGTSTDVAQFIGSVYISQTRDGDLVDEFSITGLNVGIQDYLGSYDSDDNTRDTYSLYLNSVNRAALSEPLKYKAATAYGAYIYNYAKNIKIDKVIGVEIWAGLENDAECDDIRAINIIPYSYHSAIFRNYAGIYIDEEDFGSDPPDTFENYYSIYNKEHTDLADNVWFIYNESDPSYFGGNVTVVNNITISGESGQTTDLFNIITPANEEVSVDYLGTLNIPAGQTYNIGGTPHTHATASGSAAAVYTDYVTFSGGLTSADTNVQLALNTIDILLAQMQAKILILSLGA